MNEDFSLIPLFPSVVYLKENINYNFTEDELKYFDELEMMSGLSNEASKETFILNDEKMKDMRSMCEKQLNIFTKEILGINQEFYITNSWLTKGKRNTFHHKHAHQNSIFSGVFYINASPEMGNIEFHGTPGFQRDFNFGYDIKNYNVYNSKYWWIPANTKSLIIFPSWIPHSTSMNDTDETRIMLGFNSFVKGDFGAFPESDYASRLKL